MLRRWLSGQKHLRECLENLSSVPGTDCGRSEAAAQSSLWPPRPRCGTHTANHLTTMAVVMGRKERLSN